MKCRTIMRIFSGYIDNTLKPEMIVKIDKHLIICNRCNIELNNLKKLDNAIGSIYLEKDLPQGLRESLINNLYSTTNENNKTPKKLNVNKEIFFNVNIGFKKFFKEIFSNKFKLGKLVAVIVCIVLLINSSYISSYFDNSKGLPAYISEQKKFSSIKEAQQQINVIPIVPPKVNNDFKLRDIIFTKKLDQNISINFSYEDNKFNTLIVVYTRKGNKEEYNQSNLINPNFIKVKTSTVNSTPKGVVITKDNHLTPLTQKELTANLGEYDITTQIQYNSNIANIANIGESGDNELTEIMEGYLNSELCNINKREIDNKVYKYYNFEDLKKSLPTSVKIIEPNYIPSGFKLKDIKYKMVNPNINYFIINATYENSEDDYLVIDYQLPTKGELISQNNNGIIEKNTSSYIIKARENGKGELIPNIEKRLAYSHNLFDLNVYLMYDKKNSTLDYTGDEEIQKIIGSIKNK